METPFEYDDLLAATEKLEAEREEIKAQVAQLSVEEMREEAQRLYAFLQTQGEPYSRVAGLMMDLAVLQPGDLGMCASLDEQVHRAIIRLHAIYWRMRRLGERIRQ